MFVNILFYHYWRNVFAGRIWPADCSLESPRLREDGMERSGKNWIDLPNPPLIRILLKLVSNVERQWLVICNEYWISAEIM